MNEQGRLSPAPPSSPPLRLAPRAALHLVLGVEDGPRIEVYAYSVGDEARLLEDLQARRPELGQQVLDALDEALEQLEARTARLVAGDFGRRAA